VRYGVVICDPPISYYGSTHGMGDVGKEYETMSDGSLLDLGPAIGGVMASRSVMLLWATSPRLDYRGVAFTWVKTRKDGITPIGAQGVRPSIVKPTCEFVLAGSPIPKGRPLKLRDESVRHVILHPRTGHSIKPDAVHEAVESMYPDAAKLEMFARRPRPGWTCIGNEMPGERDIRNDLRRIALA